MDGGRKTKHILITLKLRRSERKTKWEKYDLDVCLEKNEKLQFVSEKKSTSEGKAHTLGHQCAVANADELTELAEQQASMVAFICAMQGC